MASFFTVCLVVVSYSSAAGASPASIAAATPRLDCLGDDAAVSPSFAPLQLPAVYNKHLSLLAQAIRVPATPLPPANSSFPVPNGTYGTDAEIPLELFAGGPMKDGMAATYDENVTSNGVELLSPSTALSAMAATYDENVTSNGVELLSPSTALSLLYLFLVSAVTLQMYRLGLFRLDVLVRMGAGDKHVPTLSN